LFLLCRVMQVSRSGYYLWKRRGPSAREQERARLIPRVRSIHQETKATYGSRRMSQELNALGFDCGKHKAATLMKLAGVAAKQRKKFKATTDSKHTFPVAPNLLNRRFSGPPRIAFGSGTSRISGHSRGGCILLWSSISTPVVS
jgi:putative transposase